MKSLGLLLTLAVFSWPLLADEPSTPDLRDPLAFDHATHRRTFDRVHLSCVDCHPIGLSVKVDGESRPIILAPPKPLATCHGCHQRIVKNAPLRAPSTCMLCHATRSQLMPDNHLNNWTSEHALHARTGLANCKDCHENDSCVNCHERRGPGARSPHEPGFQSFHGVPARLDPASCATCHTDAACKTCHTTGSLPW